MSDEQTATIPADTATLKDAGSEEANVASNAMWPEPWGEVAQHFQQHAQDGETLDIYQMCAFMAYNGDSKCKLYFYYLKAICCALFQTVGLIIFIYNAIKETDKGLCDSAGDWDVRTIATIATLYISLTMAGTVQALDEQGLYEFDGWSTETIPPFISPRWLFIGMYVNYFSLMSAILGSFIVIYVSESALDVVLNAVALFFVVEMDDLMIDEYDYQRVVEFFKESYDPTSYPQPHQLTKCQSAFVKGTGILIVIAVLIAMFGAIAAPFYMAICF